MSASELNDRLDGITTHLDDLEVALQGQHSDLIDQISSRLHQALAETMQCAQRQREMDAATRQRLVLLRTRVAVLSAGLQRVQSSIGQTLSALLPTPAQGEVTYGAQGQAPAQRALSAYR